MLGPRTVFFLIGKTYISKPIPETKSPSAGSLMESSCLVTSNYNNNVLTFRRFLEKNVAGFSVGDCAPFWFRSVKTSIYIYR